MTLRLAKKIHRAICRGGRGHRAYSRDQVRRACLRLCRSPLLITSATAAWTPENMRHVGAAMRGRKMLVSSRCLILEQCAGLWDAVRRDERIYFEPRVGR